MSLDKTLARLLVLIKEDKELHDAILELIKAKINSENALAEYRKNRNKIAKGLKWTKQK